MTLAKPDKLIIGEPIPDRYKSNTGFMKALDAPSHVTQYRTPEGLGAHEHEGWFLYQDPATMQWHMVDPEGKEPLGVATQREAGHKIISDHNRNIARYNDLMKAEYDRKHSTPETQDNPPSD